MQLNAIDIVEIHDIVPGNILLFSKNLFTHHMYICSVFTLFYGKIILFYTENVKWKTLK